VPLARDAHDQVASAIAAHPDRYEQNWGKKYEYVLAFSNGGKVEDVTQRYTQDWDAVTQRRKKAKSKKFFLD
jgi:hypothetical protein